MNNPTKAKTIKASAPETRTIGYAERVHPGVVKTAQEIEAAQQPQPRGHTYEELDEAFTNALHEREEARNHADKLAETLQWIRKYPDVLEDKFYTRSIDEVIREYQNAKGGE